MLSVLSNIARSKGDPKVLKSGPSSLGASDRLARGLGWFSIVLGTAEILAPWRFTRFLGLHGYEGLVRAYGVREITSGVLSLSLEKHTGLWSRVGGDALDIATVFTAIHPGNPKRGNAATALLLLLGVTLLDVIGAQATRARHSRGARQPRNYQDRSGFPKGIQAAKGTARDMDAISALRSPSSLSAVQSAMGGRFRGDGDLRPVAT